MWKIEKIVRKGDYDYAVVKEHPYASKYGYVLHHRIVMENILGRLLTPSEVVHHIDHDKRNNIPENLELKDSNSTHAKEHALEKGRKYVELICNTCGETFEKPKNLFNSRSFFCSRSCSGKMQKKIQLGRITPEMKSAISVNIVREYVKYSTDNAEET